MVKLHVRAACLVAVLTPLVIIEAAPGAASGWPTWRGPNRDGKSPDTGLLKSWPADGPKRLWHLKGIGNGYSSVATAGGIVYITGHKRGRLFLTAIGDDGRVKWSQDIGKGFTGSHEGARAAPTCDGGQVYVESGMGVVGCYDGRTGREKWTRKLSEFGGRVPTWGFSESVLIVGDLALVTPGGDNFMVALNKTTGRTVWRSDRYGGVQYCSAIYVKHAGVPMIINGGHQGLAGVHAKTGKILWTQDFASGNTANCPTPAYADGYVFWAVGYGKGGICVKLTGSGSRITAKEAWRTRDLVCHHGGYVILDGHIYGNHSGGWTCLDLPTGQKKWYARGVGKGSLCYADGMLYLFGESGGKAALAPVSTEGLKLAGTVAVSGNGPSWAHPVVVAGRLYLRYDDNLYCYDVAETSAVRKVAVEEPKVDPPAKPPAVVPDPTPRPPAGGDKPVASNPEKKCNSWWKMAEGYISYGKHAAAKRYLQMIVKEYPNTPWAEKAAKRLADLP